MVEWDILNLKSSWAWNPETRKSSSREISDVLQISPDPSKVSLNHIDNLKKWEADLEKYEWEMRQKDRELSIALELADSKKAELDSFQGEKTALDIDLSKNIAILYQKLSQYVDFIDVIYNKVKSLFLDENWWIYKLPIQLVFDKENNKFLILSNKELTDSEKSQTRLQVLWWFESVGADMSNVGVEFHVQPDLDFQDVINPDKDVIDQYLQLINPDKFDDVLKMLKYSEKFKLKKLEKKMRELVEQYYILCNQINILSGKIEAIQNEYYNSCDEVDFTKDDMDNKTIEMNEKNRAYFLNQYDSIKKHLLENFVSTPLVEKQIANIIQLGKNWQKMPKTILLRWKSNLWKTYAANVLATELWYKMYHIESKHLSNWEFSDPGKMLETVFKTAIKQEEPCIIFLDGIDEFVSWEYWSLYKQLIEDTIMRNVPEINDSNLDIMVIWAISDKNKVSPSLLKQDAFSKQIYFNPLPKERYWKLFYKMVESCGVSSWDDVNPSELIASIKSEDLDQEYLKELIKRAIEFYKLNNSYEEWHIVLSSEDFENAIKDMEKYVSNNSYGLWYNR